MEFKIDPSWNAFFSQAEISENLKDLSIFLENERSQHAVFPPEEDVFKLFEKLAFENVKVVILGQDPYHGRGQAHGFAFSVPSVMNVPPSLKNIYKELKMEYPCFRIPNHGDLTYWVDQGVMLLNTTLTVREAQPGSHFGKGWERFTDSIIQLLSEQRSHLVFMLWGKMAEKKQLLIDESKHLVLTSAHPSPFSAHRGFLGCNHFVKANSYLTKMKKNAIDWQLPVLNLSSGANLEIEFPS